MTPQSNLLVVAPIRNEREPGPRHLLESMNLRPWDLNPVNDLVPFQKFTQIHFARFMIFDDQTTGPFANSFSISQTDRAAIRLSGIPRFVTVRGRAYLFPPGIRAL